MKEHICFYAYKEICKLTFKKKKQRLSPGGERGER